MTVFMKLALSYVASYWREAAILVLIGVLAGACHSRDNAIRRDQHDQDVAELTTSVLKSVDSTNKQLRDSLARVSTTFVHDSVRVTRWLTRSDTVERWRHDTITVGGVPSFPVPVATVAQTDSAKQACHDVLMDCSQFKRFAFQKFANDSTAIKTLKDHPIRIETSCKAQNAGAFLIGAGAGVLADRVFHR